MDDSLYAGGWDLFRNKLELEERAGIVRRLQEASPWTPIGEINAWWESYMPPWAVCAKNRRGNHEASGGVARDRADYLLHGTVAGRASKTLWFQPRRGADRSQLH